ncbi:MAG: YfcE family phosphodiesterase [Desulfobacteraceae bacterium]|nr:YfcE family phosphodiesterase [Desulfobacteraceae bacterium]
MTRLFVTADVHGSLNTWMTIKQLMEPQDSLVIAGDLFDTRYGNYSHTDFQPELIKQELQNISKKIYYVYGNCDIPSFFPGYEPRLEFKSFKKKIFLHHGHGNETVPDNTDIVIYGHTHLCLLKKKENQIFMNPGTITNPRNQLFTYGIIDKFQIKILDLKTGNTLSAIDL